MAKIKDAAAIAKITLGFLFASAFQVPMVRKTSGIDHPRLMLLPRLRSSVSTISASTRNSMTDSKLKP